MADLSTETIKKIYDDKVRKLTLKTVNKERERIANFYMLELCNAKNEDEAIEMLCKFMGVD